MMAPNPFTVSLPTITLTATQEAAPGGGWYFATPVATITNMPGGWQTAHYLLTLAMEEVMKKIVEEMHAQAPHVTIATQLPGGNGLVR